MARTGKTGIDYFPFDVDFFTDDKLQLIEAEFGIKGGYIAVRLLCKIYKEGYFYKWGADECLLFAKNTGIEGVSKNIVDEIVSGLVRRCFFDKGCFDRFGILTSKGIQKRYFEVAKRYKSVDVIGEYLLIDVSEMNNVHINPINVDINPQKKRKEIEKEKENINTRETKKNQFAEFVSMTNAEYQALVTEYGETDTKEFIKILDNYKGSNGKKYKSDYRAILNWVIESFREKNAKKSKNESHSRIFIPEGIIYEGDTI